MSESDSSRFARTSARAPEGALRPGADDHALLRIPDGRSVALTGVRTFLGRSLLRLLEEDDRIRRLVVIDSDTPIVAGGKTRSYLVDRTQPGAPARIAEILAAESVDTFVHLGFIETPTRNLVAAHELESVGTLHVLNACRERPVKKLVLGSSTTLYGPHYDNPNFLSESQPLRGLPSTPFLADKIDAERQVEAYAREHRSACVSVLRFAPLLGPTVESYVTRWLTNRVVPSLLGYDPLVQFVHEVDALAALKLALDKDVPGVFNIVGAGVLPLSTVIKLLGHTNVPVPHFFAQRVTELLWAAGLSTVPAPMLRFLRHLCVADGDKARRELGFLPGYTSREAVMELGATLRLREARLLTEAYA
ncbi:MAG: UDP-glucose 4-epimerase [Myxococcaceae bacterium]|nr:UDP-glucose 4-epimerase [Myxococcaceae bacterium]